ncbi:MAG: DEAD/DEAH box helicase [Clostridiales bacterium]|nr:DEAD/DEAH box helicase [Clostridiales bacterium]
MESKVNKTDIESNLSFSDMKLSEEILKSITEMGFEEATPIQVLAIPLMLEGKDIIGQAQTGTGKTCAFGIPAIEMLKKDEESKREIEVLVLCPTRELAIQLSEELKNVSKYKPDVRILPIYGGQSIERQIQSIRKKPQIIIGTPGRVMDHMRRGTLKFSGLKILILDEADEMLNMGFREDIDTILLEVPVERQTVLFSATMSREILELTKKYQKDPIHIKTVHKELTVPSTEQYYLEVRESSKIEVLSRLIDANNIKLSLVFCNTKMKVDELAVSLQSRGFGAEALHGDMKQSERDRVMTKFRNGLLDILIATDVAARGIDVNDVEAVFNYDVPNDEEYYVHRIGRTGRIGKAGKAYTFVVGRQIYELKDIQRYTKSAIKLIKPPTITDVEENRMSALTGKISDAVRQGGFSNYTAYIEKIIDEINAMTNSRSIADEVDSDDLTSPVPSNETGETAETGFVTSLDIAAALMKMLAVQSGAQLMQIPELDDKKIYGRDREGDRDRDRDRERNTDRDRDRERNKDRDRERNRGSEKSTGTGSFTRADYYNEGEDEEDDDGNNGIEKGMSRLFINIGRSSNIQPRHIVESIASGAGLPGRLIGLIDIYENYTFVEVPREYASEVLKSMKNYKIKGKRINIEKSTIKKKGQ